MPMGEEKLNLWETRGRKIYVRRKEQFLAAANGIESKNKS